MPHDQSSPLFFIVAGEASGDLLGAAIMRAVKTKTEDKVRFAGVGGPRMAEEGLTSIFPYTDLMHFGVVEVVRHVPALLRRIRQTARAVRETQAAALITIDSPDFCFRVAKLVHGDGGARIPLVHTVAPTVWAWRPGRAKKIAAFLDHLLALLPFEPPYFTRAGLPCTFIGHPLIEAGIDRADGAAFRIRHGIAANESILVVLPGSRRGELDRLLPVYGETIALLTKQIPGLRVIIPAVPHLRERLAEETKHWPIPVLLTEGEADKYGAFAAARAALACSGTVALELALARLPAVIAYKLSPLTVALFRRFMRVRFANLINIMHDKMVVPEFLQDACTAHNLSTELMKLMTDDQAHAAQKDQLAIAAEWLGSGGTPPSERAAAAILDTVARANEACVLQVLPALVTGGVERGTVETVAALHAAGLRAIVASAGGPMAHEVEEAGGIHVTLPLASKNPLTIIANIFRLRRLIAEKRVSLIHVRSRAPAWSAWPAARLAGIPLVVTFHNAYGATWWGKRFYNSAMAKGDRIIAISRFVGDYAERIYGVARDIMRVIPRGVDLAAFSPDKVAAERVEALRDAWGLPREKKIILLPGRLTRWKGQSVAIDALAQLARRDYCFVIVGGGRETPYGQELLAAIVQAGLNEQIVIKDTCRDMAAAYALADLVLVPSTRPEGFGRVVIEAQAMGVPVIATNHGGACETVIPAKTGWLTEPGDAKGLAEAIDAVLNLSPADKQNMAAHSIAHIRDNFTTDTMTAKTLAVYRELLTEGSRT